MAQFPSLASASGIWTLKKQKRAQQGTNWPPLDGASDDYFEYVSLLLPGNGTNGAQNNTFLDGSTNNFTITRNGNATQGTFTPYGSNWSNYFDGDGDYLSGPTNNAAFNFGTGDFTIEAWVYATGFPLGTETIFGAYGISNSNNYIFFVSTVGGSKKIRFYGFPSLDISSSVTIPTNQWVHVAVTRSGSTVRLFQNGAVVASATSSFSLNCSPSSPVAVGAYVQNDGNIEPSSYWSGYISNLRIVKGTAVYTAAFTPPTVPLTAITNTSLLTCQSNRFIDNSTNNFTITGNGNASVQRFSPFNPTTPYAAGTIGGSGYFDGIGDCLIAGSAPAFSFGSGDYTVECWFNPTTLHSGALFDLRGTSGTANNNGLLIFSNTSMGYFEVLLNGGWRWTTAVGSNRIGQWYHLAVVRIAGNTNFYINGVAQGSSYSHTTFITPNAAMIGGNDGGSSSAGYVTDARVVKGTGVYTANFTPPTAPLTAITNTSLLCNFTNGGIIDNAMMNDLETVGNAQISTAQSKFGGGSILFNGTNSGLYTSSSPNLAFGSGDFTVEGWVYFNANLPYLDGDGLYSAAFFGQTGTNGLALVFKSGGSSGAPTTLSFTVLGVATANTTVSIALNTWYHIAVTKASGTVRVFVNGVQQNSFANSTTFAQSVGTVGYLNIANFNDWFPGYIDDFRITKGYARYTTNFTPPTQEFPRY